MGKEEPSDERSLPIMSASRSLRSRGSLVPGRTSSAVVLPPVSGSYPIGDQNQYGELLAACHIQVAAFAALDRVQQQSYQLQFENRFLKAKGDAFQRLFEELMGRVYPGDFEACRPWGRDGDRKNDGYLPSARTLFQVYAPNEIEAASTIKKINEDFAGGKDHWQQYFDRWVFVHNAYDHRLPPAVIKTVADLRQQNPEIAIETWGYPELLAEFRKLGLADLESWFGPVPTAEDNTRVGFAEIQAVVEHIKLSHSPANLSPRPVPFGKIEFNQLPDAVAAFLKLGMEKAPLVANYFSTCRDPLYGERVAAAFKARYEELRDKQPPLHPHDIWGELDDWAGFNSTKKPIEKLAITAVLAWLFDSCDIFEEPPATQSATRS